MALPFFIPFLNKMPKAHTERTNRSLVIIIFWITVEANKTNNFSD